MNGQLIITGRGKARQTKIKAGDFTFDIRNSYTADLFTKILTRRKINFTVSVNYDYGYRVIVPIWTIDGFNEVDALLNYAIASTLDI